MKDIEEYYDVIVERRAYVIRLSKESKNVVKTSRNAIEAERKRKRRQDNSSRKNGDGKGGDTILTAEDNQFKEPSGDLH